MRYSLFFILLGIFGVLVTACQTNQTLTIREAWVRPASLGENSAVYFIIDNPTSKEDILLSASSDVSAHTEIHVSIMNEEGTMAMHHQDQVTIPPKGQVEFKPGGLHIMLINLQRELVVGDRFDLRLTFREAGAMTVNVQVRQP